MEELLEMALKKIADLERRVEKYFKILLANNELDFVLKGGYILNSDIEDVLNGK